jgi:hypothetical protein
MMAEVIIKTIFKTEYSVITWANTPTEDFVSGEMVHKTWT